MTRNEHNEPPSRSSHDLYIDLLIRTIANTIYEDPTMEPWVGEPSFDAVKRSTGSDWPKSAHTMVGTARLENLAKLTREVILNNIPGSLIETGVWRGGCCILLQGILTVYGETSRKLFVCDSFEGLPKPDDIKYPADKGDIHHSFPQLAVSLDVVRNNFDCYGLLNDNIKFIKGYFEETLPALDVGPFALIRLDGDMYSSTIIALESLYHQLSPGGFCIIDDYGAVPACRQAVDDFRLAQGIAASINTIDWTGVWWQKPNE